MKKIFIAFFFCLHLSLVVAQDNATIQETVQDPNWPVLLSNLNTSQITSGILIDKVTTFAGLYTYNEMTNEEFNNQINYKNVA